MSDQARNGTSDDYVVHPPSWRWTHIALPTNDIDQSIGWYEHHTPLRLLDRREDLDGWGVWLGHPDNADKPFILVLVCFRKDHGCGPQPTMTPFAHIGIEVTSRAEIDEIAQKGEQEGCLFWPAAQMPPPIGYICALKDPDGNVIEFSYDQGVYAKAQEVWGVTADAAGIRIGVTPDELVRTYLGAFGTGDPQAVAACVTDDFVNEHTAALGSGCEGKPEYLRRLPNFIASMGGPHYDVDDVVVDGDRAAAAYTLHATVNERMLAVRGVMWFRIRDGLIAKRTDYWDSLVFQRQAGLA